MPFAGLSVNPRWIAGIDVWGREAISLLCDSVMWTILSIRRNQRRAAAMRGKGNDRIREGRWLWVVVGEGYFQGIER
jgi:hypothetical protein